MQVTKCIDDEESLPDWHQGMADIDPVQAAVKSELVNNVKKKGVVIKMEGQR